MAYLTVRIKDVEGHSTEGLEEANDSPLVVPPLLPSPFATNPYRESTVLLFSKTMSGTLKIVARQMAPA